ncbi:MAG: hypothetical protein QM500_19470 [Methylococcales bacterium]
MKFIGHNIYSILGFQITEIPEYCDKKRVKITFSIPSPDNEDQHIEVSGTRTVFGLVLHKKPTGHVKNKTWYRWIITEPNTGLAITWGYTRQETLDSMALHVACYGGEGKFQSLLNDSIERALSAKRACKAC